MWINYPLCDLKTCRKQFDGNCTDKRAYEVCPYMNPWIPVTERLPEENGRYIICYEDATTFLDYFNGKWFFPIGKGSTAWEETGTIIAWMPLPEPYIGGEIDE